jgi:hypothetical protein
VDTERIEAHFDALLNTKEYRHYGNTETLDSIAVYIYSELSHYADSAYFQSYEVDGNTYRNVISVFGSENPKTIVLGAHYDVCGNQDGADDNASAVIALLEIARMLKGQKLKYRIELAAYTLEEPPFFRTKDMGSYRHAQSHNDAGTDIYGMLAMDMIGFFSDNRNTQHYPIGLLSWFYGTKGDYILLTNKWGKGQFARRFSRAFKRQNAIKVKRLSAPRSVEGLDWSDHLNFWAFDYSASLITDTGPNRNLNYHMKSDTLDTIDIERMSQVIQGVYLALLRLN